MKGLKAEIQSLQGIQRPVNSEVEELKKALQATKNVMEYKETEEEHAAYNKVKCCWVFKQLRGALEKIFTKSGKSSKGWEGSTPKIIKCTFQNVEFFEMMGGEYGFSGFSQI